MPDDPKVLKHNETEARKPDEISPEELDKVSGGFEVHQKTAGDQDD
ncbi:MAG TPA: hypothetical protein VK335_35155 [Bryobacteraceae bacterium]|nr:hypothetical protein [Bryobacteraceae bacterium]